MIITKKQGIFYNLMITMILFIIMILVDRSDLVRNTLAIGLVFIITTYGLIINKDYEKSIVYLLGLCLPINLVVFSNEVYNEMIIPGAYIGLQIKLYDVLILMIFIVSLRYNNVVIKKSKAFILSVIYIIINILSIGVSLNYEASIYEVIRLIKYIILLVAIIKVFDLEKYNIFINGLGKAIIIQFILGMLQILKGGALGLSVLGESEYVFRSGVYGLEKGMSGTLGHPGTMALFSLFCLSLFIFSKKTSMKPIYVLISILTIIMTFARTSIALMILIITIYLIRRTKYLKLNIKEIIFMNFIVISLIIGGFIFSDKVESISDRFLNSDFNEQFWGRGEHSQIALDIYRNSTNWAYGANNYTYASKYTFPYKYNMKYFNYIFPVHNIYLLYLVEIGLFGMLVYIILNLCNIINSFKIFKKKYEDYKHILISCGVWTLVFMIYNFTGWSAAKDTLMQCMWICIGISEMAYQRKKININDI